MIRSKLVAIVGLTILGSGAAGAAPINLWFGDGSPLAHFPTPATTGSIEDPPGSNNGYWQSDPITDGAYGTFQIRAYGYRTTDANGTDVFLQSTVMRWPGGVGVCNDNPLASTDQVDPCSSPHHAVDNAGPDDLILIDFGAGHQYSAVTFSIGWENSSPCTDIAVAAGCPDIDIWIGSSWLPPNRWSSIEGASDWMRVLTAGIDIQPSTTGNAHYYDLDGSVTGQYLVIAGQRLSGNNDYFTLQSLVLDRHTVPEPSATALDLNAVPEPSATALAVLALGFGLLMASRRRKT